MAIASQIVERRATETRAWCHAKTAELGPWREGLGIEVLLPPGPKDWNGRTSLPRGLTVSQALLFETKPIFCLQPTRDFKSVYGMTLEAAIELTEQGVAISDIYVRNPKDWEDNSLEYMTSLLTNSTVVGEVVDIYMNWRDQNFTDNIARRRSQIVNSSLSMSDSQRQLVAHRANIAPARLEDITAHRWAYLDTLSPESSERAAKFLASSDYRNFFTFIEAAKHVSASNITGCLGGEFIWGGLDIEIHEAFSNSQQLEAKSFDDLNQSQREALKYLHNVLLELGSVPIPDRPDARKIAAMIRNSEFLELRKKISEGVRELAQAATLSGISSPQVRDYRQAMNAYRDLVRKFSLGGKSAIGIATSVGVGAVIGPTIGAVAGAGVVGSLFVEPIESLAEAVVERSSRSIRSSLARHGLGAFGVNAKLDRVITIMDELKSLTRH